MYLLYSWHHLTLRTHNTHCYRLCPAICHPPCCLLKELDLLRGVGQSVQLRDRGEEDDLQVKRTLQFEAGHRHHVPTCLPAVSASVACGGWTVRGGKGGFSTSWHGFLRVVLNDILQFSKYVSKYACARYCNESLHPTTPFAWNYSQTYTTTWETRDELNWF